MKRLISSLVLTSFLTLPSVARSDERWKITMRTLENSLQTLLYESSSSERFADALKRDSFQKEIARFSSAAGELSERKGTSGDADPSIELISSLFKQEAQHLQWAAKNKNTDYARHLVLSMTQYCIACHTRTPGGIEFSSRSGNEKIEALNATERASYLISTRQFDLALAELQKQLSDQKLPEENLRDWERSTRLALSLSIRVKNGPSRHPSAPHAARRESSPPGLSQGTSFRLEKIAPGLGSKIPAKIREKLKRRSQETHRLRQEIPRVRDGSIRPSLSTASELVAP